MTKPLIGFQNGFFESLITKSVTGNTGSFRTVSDAKITSGIFSRDKIVEVNSENHISDELHVFMFICLE